jgi:cleavage and polyadenylation specificity factor subunit 1
VDSDGAGGGLHLLEVVTCSGHGKNGSLCVLQRAVQPTLVSSFPTPGVRDVFALRGSPDPLANPDAHHRFLLLSSDGGTVVLGCHDNDLTRLPTSDFYTAGPTLFAGALASDERIVQVHGTGLRLLDGTGTRLYELPLRNGAPVVACSLAGPYVLVHHGDGNATLAVLDANQHTLLDTSVPAHAQVHDLKQRKRERERDTESDRL